MTPPLTLSEMSDAQIEAAVAEHVAGFKWRTDGRHAMLMPDPPPDFMADTIQGKDGAVLEDAESFHPSYLTDANAVIPLLAKDEFHKTEFVNLDPKSYRVEIYESLQSRAPIGWSNQATFCRAACFALLRGVPGLVREEKS